MRISDWSSDVCSSDLPVAGRLGRLVADIAAQQVHRAMRQVHVAHQAEHQGEAACDKEIEPSQGEAVQEGVHEGLLAADGVLQPFRPEGEDEPEEDSEGSENEAQPEAVEIDDRTPNTTARETGRELS